MKMKMGQTFDEDSQKIACDVPGHSEGMPGVNGTIREDDTSGSDVISSIFLIGLLNGIVQWGAQIINISALLQVIAEGKEIKIVCFYESKRKTKPFMHLQTNQPQDTKMALEHTHGKGNPLKGWFGESVLW